VYNSNPSATSVEEGGGWSVQRRGCFLPGKTQEVEWASGPVWTSTENLAFHWKSIPRPANPQQPLCRLRYPGRHKQVVLISNEVMGLHEITRGVAIK